MLLVAAAVLTTGQIDLLTAAGPVVNAVRSGLALGVVVLGLAVSPALAKRLPQAWARLVTGCGEDGAA